MEAFFCRLFPVRTWFAIVGIRIDGKPPSRGEFAPYFDELRVHELDQIFHDDIDAVLVEVPMVAEGEKVEFEGFGLYHLLVRYIGDIDGGKVRLPCHRAEGSKFWTVEFNEIVVFWVFILEGLQYLRGVICWVVCGMAKGVNAG